MITNLPTSADFYQSGKELFNFAWDATSTLLTEFDQADQYGFDKDEVSENYWLAARRTLTTSLTIVQQGVEFILKGKIAEISPYLLISDPPTRWPTPYQSSPIDFSQFRTVDAQDLIRILDTFSPTQYSAEFVDKFHALRERRNAIMHSVGSGVTVGVVEVVEAILYMHKALFPSENWATIRKEFLETSPDSELGSGEYATNGVCWEFSIVRDMLSRAQILAFMGVDKKQRAYLCPKCYYDANKDADDFKFKLAVLRPKGSSSTRLYCPVCNAEHEVERTSCEESECLGNVISAEFGTCCTCGS
jgi:hypothetical protein